MGIDFDESGKNEEYEADANESTGEVNDPGKPRQPAQPIVVAPTPQMHGNVNDLVASIMGTNPSQNAPQSVAEALETSQDEYMDQVEERLDVAAHYRILLSNPMFDNNTRAANIVTHEMQGFIRERLGVLLGIGEPTKKKELFTETQVETLRALGDLTPAHATALKMVASKLLGEAPPPRDPPVVRPAPAPSAPATTPAPAPSGPRRAAPARTPVSAAASTQPQEAPTAPQKPRGPGRPPGSRNRPKPTETLVPAVRKHADGSEEPLFNEDGTPKMVRVQRVQRPAGAMPFPNEMQMAQVTAALSGNHAAKLEANPQVQAALKGLQNPV